MGIFSGKDNEQDKVQKEIEQMQDMKNEAAKRLGLLQKRQLELQAKSIKKKFSVDVEVPESLEPLDQPVAVKQLVAINDGKKSVPLQTDNWQELLSLLETISAKLDLLVLKK